jgi:hypothetical protein
MMRFLKISVFGLIALSCAATGTSLLISPSPFGPAIAPDPETHAGPVIQVYGADVWGVRGHFAIHTWVATKNRGEPTYTIYQVIGWRLQREGTAVSITQGMPDRPWFRSPAILLHEVKGPAAAALIPQVAQAARDYPYAGEYVMWPGPNSNSFTEWIAQEVPELELDLPFKAIGKNWMQATYPELRPYAGDSLR